MKKASWTMIGLLVFVLALGLVGCTTEEDTTNVNQSPFEDPPVTPWLFAVWGTAADDVYAVGRPGVILHWNGSQWSFTQSSVETLTDVWGTGASEIYAVGHGGAILRGSGNNWSTMTSGTEENLYAVGDGPYDAIYAVGEKGVIRQLSGNTWGGTEAVAYRYALDGTPEDTLIFDQDIQSLTVVTPFAIGGDMATVLMENDSDLNHQWLWGPIEDQAQSFIYASTTGPGDTDTYIANKGGRLFNLVDHPSDGLTWLKITDPDNNEALPATFPSPITGLWLDTNNDRLLMTTSSGRICSLARDGTSTEILYADTAWLSDIWGSGDGMIWVVGKNGLMLLSDDDGVTWDMVPDLPIPEVATKSLTVMDKFGRPLP